MSEIKFPAWDVRQTPTPSETLYVCDGCGHAFWGPAGLTTVCHNCKGRKGGYKRMRVATAAEQAEGKKHLKTIIGAKP